MIAILLLGLLATAAAEKPSSTLYDDVLALFDDLETSKDGLLYELSGMNTDCSSIDDELSLIKHGAIPFHQELNANQDILIEQHGAQLKAIQHRVHVVLDKVEEIERTAGDTAQWVASQLDDYLEGPLISDVDDQQDMNITEISTASNDQKEDILNDLLDNVDLEYQALTESSKLIDDISNFVNSRKCESGFGTYAPGLFDIEFETAFTSVPVVTLQIVGYSTHLDVKEPYHHEKPDDLDLLGLDKYIDYVNTEGFGIKLDEITEGSVALKSVSCSWMACQNLAVGFELEL